MSIDAIAHLKMKRLARKKTAVADIDEDDQITDLPAKTDTAAKKPFHVFNELTTKNRSNIMESTGKVSKH